MYWLEVGLLFSSALFELESLICIFNAGLISSFYYEDSKAWCSLRIFISSYFSRASVKNRSNLLNAIIMIEMFWFLKDFLSFKVSLMSYSLILPQTWWIDNASVGSTICLFHSSCIIFHARLRILSYPMRSKTSWLAIIKKSISAPAFFLSVVILMSADDYYISCIFT